MRAEQRPSSCRACPLDPIATGFSKPVGPVDSKLLFMGEALGKEEVKTLTRYIDGLMYSTPFVGMSGGLLNRTLQRLGKDRMQQRIHNIVSCRPPSDKLSKMPWERDAIAHCRQHRLPVLEEQHKVIVALGAIPAKELLSYPSRYSVRSFHGCPVETQWGYVVPTFHPSFIIQGNPQFTEVLIFDLLRAFDVADHGWQQDPYSAIVDPSPEWFALWASQLRGDEWLISDIETAGKIAADQRTESREDEDDAGEDDDSPGSWQILRISFSYHPDEAVSVPWEEPYISTCKKLLARKGPLWFWNWRYDVPRLQKAGCVVSGPVLEGMDLWGALRPRLPRRIAFVAPFYSTLGPWKHLAGANLGLYSALDSIQECRVIHGVAKDLEQLGKSHLFWRYRNEVDVRVLHPGERVGLLIDKPELQQFGEGLAAARADLKQEFQKLTAIGKVTIKRKVKDSTGYQSESIEQPVLCCSGCSAVDVTKKHRCKDKKLQPAVSEKLAMVTRWVKREAFNSGSRPQVLEYLKQIGEEPGIDRDTHKPTVGKTVLQDIVRRRKDPLLKAALREKAIAKVEGTYYKGVAKRLAADGRLHWKSGHAPWTGRLSTWDPNMQNIVGGEEEEDKPESGFKRVVVPAAGCVLVEADFAGIEAVLSGYFMDDPVYARLAMLGMHAYLLSHKIGKPTDLTQSDDVILQYHAELKSTMPKPYHACKRTVHLTNYVGTPWAMHDAEPELFPNLKVAGEFQQLYFKVCPKLPQWWNSLWDFAHRHNYLENPYGFRAQFWEIHKWNPWKRVYERGRGADAKKAVSFKPQSTGYFILADAALDLTDPESANYVGDMYQQLTPIRPLIHDSILFEVPRARAEELCGRVQRAFSAPLTKLPLPDGWPGAPGYLKIGVDIKIGERNWAEMRKWQGMKEAA